MDQASSAEQSRGLGAFVADAYAVMRQRGMLLPALLLLVVLTGSNIVILFNLPRPDAMPPLPFLLAAFARIAGLLVISSAMLRIGAPSERPAWRLDGGFWLYTLSVLASVAVAAGTTIALGEKSDPLSLAARSAIDLVILAPFATWFVGMNVATPLGWRPTRFMRDFRGWLPPLVFWSLLLITPIGVLHAVIDFRLVAGVGDMFWPLALFDGALSTVIALTGFGLNLAAYRRVAPN
jgi:hypothetical protein